MRCRQTLNRFAHVAGFGARLLQKFQPRGRRLEQIADLDPRALLDRGGLGGDLAPRIDFNRPRFIRICRPAGNNQPCDRSDRRQGLTTKAKGENGLQAAIGQFGGRMAFDRELQIRPAHAAPIVGDGNQALTAFFDGDVDAGGAGVDGVFQQLLDGGSRALDHLARGDAIDQRFRQAADGREGGQTHAPIRA